MFRNFLKVAFRNIFRHKVFSFINIAGLTLGLAACVLIFLFVRDEYGYDKFMPDSGNIYRVYNHYKTTEVDEDRAISPPVFASVLKREYPEVLESTRVMALPAINRLFESGQRKFYESNGLLVDSTFFNVFPISFKYGQSTGSLNGSSSIVLSDEMAERLFGRQNPVGKQLLLNNNPFLVTGVYRKNPAFHLQFNYLLPIAAGKIPAERMQSWVWQQFYTYVKLSPIANPETLQGNFQKLVNTRSAADLKEIQASYRPRFQQLSDIHLHSANFKFDVTGQGNIGYTRALTITALFILLIACLNFVNLATARSLQRAKEVGVRKSIGAGRRQLVIQFLGETILFSLISIVVAATLAVILLPWLNQFTGKHIPLKPFLTPGAFTMLFLFGVVIGILAGFYPAIILSSFKPVNVLKGSGLVANMHGKSGLLRHSLVVTQFTLSILLMISATVVFKQVSYLHNKDLGFNKSEIMFFPLRGANLSRNPGAFKNRMLQVPGVSLVSIGYGFPGDAVAGDEIKSLKNGSWVKQSVTQLMIDDDYIQTLGIQTIAGRPFQKNIPTDKDHAFMINETAVKQLGFGTPEKAIGQALAWNPWDAANKDSLKKGYIIGVVKDFHYKSLYDKVEAAVLQIYPEAASKVAVKLSGEDIQNTITDIEKLWSGFSPQYPLEYSFLDDNFKQMYKMEDKLKTLVWIFTCVAIFVGCLGLFGLATYTAERRQKEVGIRKVLGASTAGIVLLLTRNFLQLVMLSFLVAAPIAWLIMQKWLQSFAYRIDISWWIFALSAGVAIVIAFGTVSAQAIKAAIANPVKTLRMD